MDVQERTIEVKRLMNEALRHPMCLRFEDQKYHYFVRCPDGFQIDAIRVDKTMGKAKALQILIDKMEEYWIRSCVTYKEN